MPQTLTSLRVRHVGVADCRELKGSRQGGQLCLTVSTTFRESLSSSSDAEPGHARGT